MSTTEALTNTGVLAKISIDYSIVKNICEQSATGIVRERYTF